MDCRTAALSYLERGWCPLPVLPGDKRPRHNWRAYQDKLPTREQIESWWQEHPEDGVGLVLGHGGLCVIDIDDPELAGRVRSVVAHTRMARTRSGGLHVYVQSQRPVPTSKPAPKVDIKGWGSFVVAPPTEGYRWLTLDEPALVLDGVSWAEAILAGAGVEVRPRAAGYKAAEQAVIPASRRNETLASIGARLLQAGLARDWVEAALNGINERWCQPPLDAEEMGRTVGRIGERFTPAPFRESGGMWVEWGGGRIDVEEKPVGYLIEDFLPDTMISILFGYQGTGKTYLAQLAAICLAEGLPFLELQTRPSRVLWLDWETEPWFFWRRIRRLCRGLGLEHTPKNLLYLRPEAPLKACISQVRQHVAMANIDVGVIDSCGMALAGYNLESSGETVEALQLLRSVAIPWLVIDHMSRPTAGQSVEGKGVFGSIYKEIIGRSIWKCRRLGTERYADHFDVSVVLWKNNFDLYMPPLDVRVKMSEAVVTIERLQGTIAQVIRALAAHGGSATARVVAETVGVTERHARRLLETLVALGHVQVEKDGKPSVYALVEEE